MRHPHHSSKGTGRGCLPHDRRDADRDRQMNRWIDRQVDRDTQGKGGREGTGVCVLGRTWGQN